MSCNHEFVMIDVYTITEKKVDAKTEKIIFSKKIGKTYTFACKFCLEIKQKSFFFSGGEKIHDN